MTACKSYHKYQAIYEPRCNCTSCWDMFFSKHLMHVEVAKVGIKEFGLTAVKKVRGDNYVKQLLRYMKEHNVNSIS